MKAGQVWLTVLATGLSGLFAATNQQEHSTASPVGPIESQTIIFQNRVQGTIGRTVADKLTETLSVRDFGAKGDGITDDTESIQKALDYFGVPNNRSGKISVPQGAYKITAPLFYQGDPGTGFTL